MVIMPYPLTSTIAATPAIIMVALPIANNPETFSNLTLRGTSNRIIRYTPAVTSVEECTRADTGVGAAMAAGSQDEKGTWALLVNLARIRSPAKTGLNEEA